MAQSASEATWDGDASNYKDADEYCSACLIDTNPSGQPKTKGLCHLPVRAPGSKTPNRTAMGAAAAALAGARGGVKLSATDKKKAARKLLAMYRSISEDAPDALKTMGS